MTDKNHVITELADLSWLWKLTFLVDITRLLNELNLKLQGVKSLISDLYSHIKAFKLKLTLFTQQLIKENLIHFPTCIKFKIENHEKFSTDFAVGVLSHLKEQFYTRFRDFENVENRIRIFESPFAVEIETSPTEIQLKLFELTSNNHFKNYFKENTFPQL